MATIEEAADIKEVFAETGRVGILDIETGGFSKTKNGVCEIALLVVSFDLKEVIAEESWLIKPYPREEGSEEFVSYKDDAMAVNGISVAELEEEGLFFKEVCRQLSRKLFEYNVLVIAGHNIKTFDIPRVDHLFIRSGIELLLSHFIQHDTLEKAKSKLSLPGYGLDALCEHFEIQSEVKHRALADCHRTHKLMQKLD